MGILANALGLNTRDRAELFVAAGYWPDNLPDWRVFELTQKGRVLN